MKMAFERNEHNGVIFNLFIICPKITLFYTECVKNASNQKLKNPEPLNFQQVRDLFS